MFDAIAILFALAVVFNPIPAQAALVLTPMLPEAANTGCSEYPDAGLSHYTLVKCPTEILPAPEPTSTPIRCAAQYYLGIDGNCYPEPSVTPMSATSSTSSFDTVATTTDIQQKQITDQQLKINDLEKRASELETQKLATSTPSVSQSRTQIPIKNIEVKAAEQGISTTSQDVPPTPPKNVSWWERLLNWFKK